VEDALQRRDLVGGEALGECPDDRHPAGDGGLEADGPAGLAGGVEDGRAVLGQQRLVGGDDVLAGGQGVEHDLPGDAGATDQLDDDVDGRVGEGGGRVGGEQVAGEFDGAGLVRVADDD